jgi:hypothetical protein
MGTRSKGRSKDLISSLEELYRTGYRLRCAAQLKDNYLPNLSTVRGYSYLRNLRLGILIQLN